MASSVFARRGRSVLFTTCQMLVQELLRAKRDLRMERLIKKLSKYEALIIDDLGYVQQSREEVEVLFMLLSERYERGRVLSSSNLPFSKWERMIPGSFQPEANLPLTLVSYTAGLPVQAWIEPIAVGATLTPMPLFLTREHYIPLPLEQNYIQAWQGMPARWQDVITKPPSS